MLGSAVWRLQTLVNVGLQATGLLGLPTALPQPIAHTTPPSFCQLPLPRLELPQPQDRSHARLHGHLATVGREVDEASGCE